MKQSNRVPLSFTILVLASGLSACNNMGSPQSVVASAYHDLQKNDLAAFKETLSEEALAHYGTPASASQLQQKISGLTLGMGDVEMTSSQNDGGGQWTQIYTVPVLSKGSLVFTIGVSCQYAEAASCMSGSNPTDGPLGGCQNYSVFCSITSIL